MDSGRFDNAVRRTILAVMARFFTDRDVGLVRYLAEIERYPVLGRDDELALGRRARAGDREAADRLLTSSLRFVPKIASGYGGHGFRTGDLIAEGNLGLMEAIRRFDPDRGLRFMTYAGYWVRAFILAHLLRQWSLVGAGTGPRQSRMFFRLSRERGRLMAQLGDAGEVTRRLARKFGTTAADVEQTLHRIEGGDVSLDAPAPGGGPTALDRLTSADAGPEADHERRERTAAVGAVIEEVLAGMDARESLIVRRRLLADEPATLAHLGRRLGVSRERVRQLEQRVKDRLRAALAGFRAA
jgi:RNA polymerase sigma-32 factor